MKHQFGITTLVALAFAALCGCDQQKSVTVQTGKNDSSSGSPVASGADPSNTPAIGTSASTDTGTSATTNPSGTSPSSDTSSVSTGTPSTTPGAPVASSDGSVTLRLVFAKGASMKYASTTETSMDMPNPSGKSTPAKPMKSASEMSVKVLDVTGDKSKVEITSGNMKLSGGPDDANTKKMLESAAKSSEGVKVSALFDALGKPSDLKYENGTKAQAMAAGIDSDTGFFGVTYPEKAVKPGDTWVKSWDFKNAMAQFGQMPAEWKNSMITTKFTLKSVDLAAGTAVISIESNGTPEMSIKIPTPPTKDGKASTVPKSMSMTFKVSGTGSTVVDVKTGIPVNVTYDMGVDMKSPMMNMKQKTKATMKKVS